jgi:hypothetical protein
MINLYMVLIFPAKRKKSGELYISIAFFTVEHYRACTNIFDDAKTVLYICYNSFLLLFIHSTILFVESLVCTNTCSTQTNFFLSISYTCLHKSFEVDVTIFHIVTYTNTYYVDRVIYF